MSIVIAKKLTELHLSTMPGSYQIAWENVKFTPDPASMYLAVQYKVNSPDDPVLGAGYHRENLQMQIFVCDLVNKGSSGALGTAQTIRDRFKKGSTFIQDDVRVLVLTTPRISGSVVTSDRLVVPVMIDLTVEVYSG
jgi:hypothetical protein